MKLLSLAVVFFTINILFVHQLPIKGKWINNGDSKTVIIITSNRYIEIYNRDTIYTGSYRRDVYSCDTSYAKNTKAQKLDFIKVNDGRCFEIVGVTSSTLSLRYTTSGKLQLFRK